MNNFEYHQKRVEEVRELFSFLHDRVSLEGDRFLSIGCGTAPEFEFLSETFRDLVGIDQNIELVEFCKKNIHIPNAKYFHKIAGVYLEEIPDKSLNLVFVLDIDSNVFVTEIISQLKAKLKNDGILIITERRDNSRIYNRQFIAPFIKEIKERFGEFFEISLFRRESEMDQIVLVLKIVPKQ